MATPIRIIIVGGGRVGNDLAALLLASEHHVQLIEMRRDEIDHLQRDLPRGRIILGNGTDPDLLESEGIREANVVAAMTGADETNLVVTSLAHFEFGVPRTIARVNHPKNAWMFTPDMGVDVALNQADLMAHLIAEEMSLGDMMTLLKLHKGHYSLIEERVHPQALAAGRAVRNLELPAKCVLTAIIRDGQLIPPRGDTVIQPNDEVLAVVHAAHTAQLAALFGKPE